MKLLKFKVTLLFLLLFSISNYLYQAYSSPVGILDSRQKQVIKIIEKNTQPNDFVISDEAILNGVSKKLPPPELSDISSVRIYSRSLTSEKFAEIIVNYKPRLIISWNGRLKSIRNFDKSIKNYELLSTIDNSKNIYINKP